MENNKKNKSKIPSIILIIILIGILGFIFYLKYQENQLAHNKIINQNLVTNGSGLYADTYETGLNEKEPFSSKYYFSGAKINNYLLLDNNCFRIINIAQNETIKIMHVGITKNQTCKNLETTKTIVPWDENNSNNWKESSLKTYLEEWLKDIKLSKSSYIVKSATWYLGGIQFFANGNLTEDIKMERDEESKYNGIIGIINTSDFMKASGIRPINKHGAFYDGCVKTGPYYYEDNYLHTGNKIWTMNKTLGDKDRVWALENNILESKYTDNKDFHTYPVVYLKDNLKLKGKGTIENPYVIIENEE